MHLCQCGGTFYVIPPANEINVPIQCDRCYCVDLVDLKEAINYDGTRDFKVVS